MTDSVILLMGSLAMLIMVLAILLFGLLYQNKIRRKNDDIQKIKNLLYSTELTATNNYLKGQAEEKRRIASELHDGIGSELTVLKLKLDNGITTHEELNQGIDDIIVQIRSISHELYKGMFAYDNLDVAIEHYINEIVKHSDLMIDYNNYGLNDNEDNERGYNIFRIVQELLQNTIKHAKATVVHLDISYHKEDFFNIIYTDNGIGIKENRETMGIGIINMKDRIQQMNGIMSMQSTKGKGMEVVINCELS